MYFIFENNLQKINKRQRRRQMRNKNVTFTKNQLWLNMLWLKIRPQEGSKELSLRFDASEVDESGSWSCNVCEVEMLARTIVEERCDSANCSVFRRIRFCSICCLLGGYNGYLSKYSILKENVKILSYHFSFSSRARKRHSRIQ